METERFCTNCRKSIGLMSQTEYDTFVKINLGMCDDCWKPFYEPETLGRTHKRIEENANGLFL